MVNAWEQLIQPELKIEHAEVNQKEMENQKIEEKETSTENYNVTSHQNLNHKVQPKQQFLK